jgi:hypothetical protein
MVLTRDILLAWQAIDNGVVAATTQTRQKYWAYWKSYTAAYNQDAFMLNCNAVQRSIIITAFAARVRSGYYGLGKTVGVQTVTNALSAVSKTIELAGQPSPVYQAPKTYTLPVARLVEGFRRQDPPSVPQLAIPVAVPNEIIRNAYKTSNPKLQTTADLSLMAFYYLLRVGEYTRNTRKRKRSNFNNVKRTITFTVGSIGFFKNGKILPRKSDLKTLLTTDQCTLKLTNQKNGQMGQTIHHHALTDSSMPCPVQAVARRVHHILANGGNSNSCICDYLTPQGTWAHVTSNHIVKAIRAAISTLKLHESGITPELVGSHSLRAGGAMALKLQGFNDTTIMKQGRWRSLTFLQYIHNQIAHLSKDMSNKMSEPLLFLNIASIETAEAA